MSDAITNILTNVSARDGFEVEQNLFINAIPCGVWV